LPGQKKTVAELLQDLNESGDLVRFAKDW